jgi:hypothetical protein
LFFAALHAFFANHLLQVGECLDPGVGVRFSLWLLTQNDAFYDRQSFWPSLVYKEIGMTTEEAEELKVPNAAFDLFFRRRLNISHSES